MPTFDNSYPVSEYVFNSSNAVVPSSPYVTLNRNVTCRITKGGPIPNWRFLIALGKGCTTVMDGVRARYIPVSTRLVQLQKGGPLFYDSSGTYNSASARCYESATNVIGSTHDLTAYGNASAKFLQNYQKKTRQLEAFVSLGELGETLRGLVNPLKSFRRGLGDLITKYETQVKRFGRHRVRYATKTDRASTLLEMLSGTWLEWRFGMLPTISDIDGAARAIAAIAERPDKQPHISVRGTGKVESHEITEHQLSFAGGWSHPDNRFELDTRNMTSVRIIAGISTLAESYPTPYDALGLTIEDFVPSLYELIPLSFLEGYFGNMKDILDVWSHQFMQVSWVCRNTLRERRSTASGPTHLFENASYRTQGDGFKTKSLRREVFRIPLDPNSFLHIPAYNFTIPGVGTRWINMGALAAQYQQLLNGVGRTLRI